MYCLSKDGLRMTEAKGFGITSTTGAVRYYRDGEFKYSLGQEMHCIFTNNGFFMDAFDNETEAKEKLREAMNAAAIGLESFEF